MDNGKEDRIRVRAYEIWQRTGRQDGSHIEHWDRAAREIEDEDAERGSMATEQVAGANAALAKHSKDASTSTPPKRGRKSAEGTDVPMPGPTRASTAEMNAKTATVPVSKPQAPGTRSAKADPDRKDRAGAPKSPKTSGAPVRDVRDEPSSNPNGDPLGKATPRPTEKPVTGA